MHIFTSRQSGDILILPGFGVRSSAVEPSVEESCYRVPKSLLATVEVKYRKSVSLLLPFHNFMNNRSIINHKHQRVAKGLCVTRDKG